MKSSDTRTLRGVFTRLANGRIFGYLVYAFIFAFSTFPIAWVLMSSFKTNSAIIGSPFSLPKSLGFSAYVDIFRTFNFGLYTFNSFFIATVSTVLAVFIYSSGAYVFAKFRFPGKNLLFILFTATLLVPPHARAQPIFSIVQMLGIYDTRVGLIVVYLSLHLALALFIMRATFASQPKALIDAARIDGASFYQTFLRISLPLAQPGLITIGVLMFIRNWNEFFMANLLTGSESSRTLPVTLAFFNQMFAYNYPKMFAALTVTVVPGIVLYGLFQERITSSVAQSGLKG